MAEEKLQLFVKASKDGKGLGDCPFCQCVQMVCQRKGVRVELVYIDLANKPADFLAMAEPVGGSVPILRVGGGQVVCGSGDILSHIQEKYPLPDMKGENGDRVADVTKGIFPAFVAIMKNKDAEQQVTLEDRLVTELEMVNAWLVSNPGPFLCGRELSIHDCSLVPKLYHLRVAGKHYRQFSIPERLHALHGYYGRVVSLAPFTETAYGSDEIIHGWSRFFV